MKKIAMLASTLALSVAAPNTYAAKFLSSDEFKSLLPKTGYQVDLGDQISLPYHCDLREEGSKFALDMAKCERFDLNFKRDNASVVNLGILGKVSTSSIVEHKLWAMAFAHAAFNSMVLMQFGLDKEGGTFDLSKPFAATGEKFGDYFARNMGVNYYVSKGLQESTLGRDLPNIGMGKGDDDGVLQIEYPGSAFSELQGAGHGGFPAVFAPMDPMMVLSSNNGPARNILGSAAAAAYYNASATGINTGSLPWSRTAEGVAQPGNRIHQFIQGSRDPDALAIMLSFMYNRGPYAAKDQPMKDEATFQYCMGVTELVNDWKCFTKQNDFGTRYIRQIPTVAKLLGNSPVKYEERLSWTDVSAYLELLENYGFYPSSAMVNIKKNAQSAFNAVAKNGSISYRYDFGRIVEAVLTSAPIKTFAQGVNDPDVSSIGGGIKPGQICQGEWNAALTYDTPGMVVSYKGKNWKSSYWNTKEEPGVAEYGPWTVTTECAASGSTPAPVATSTPAPTAVPTAVPTVAPTATLKPVVSAVPSATPKPSATPTPSATPKATATPKPTATPIATAPASSAPAYVSGVKYKAGDRVSNAGVVYECKIFPYDGWCSGSAAFYAPGTGSNWADAWIKH